MTKKSVLGRDNLSGIKFTTLWNFYFFPGKLILWVRYIAAPKGKVFATARQAKSPIFTFLAATLFWLSAAYIGYVYFYYSDKQAQVSFDRPSVSPLKLRDDLGGIPSGLLMVQLGAYATEAGAISAWKIFSENYPAVFPDREHLILQSRVNEEIVYFRLNIIGFSSELAADQFCKELKGIKLDCLIVLLN